MKQYGQFVEPHRQRILDTLDYIWKNPETGYREWKTHAYLEEEFAKLGYALTLAGDIPGFYADVDTGRPGPTVAVFGELDALLVPGHPDADPATGAVHACGHCAQAAALLGLAAALKEPGALDDLSGKIRLVAVPAEELIEVEYRLELRQKGIIRYMGGKQEFLYRGMLDGVDMAFMIHTTEKNSHVNRFWNGCVAKSTSFQGVSAHAGSAPHKGVNALYAANLSLNAINALRETFLDDSHIRVHPILTAAGGAVNAIPDLVQMEAYVRGKTIEDIVAVNKKVNRAMAASAAAMGANVHLLDIPGYMPESDDLGMMEVSREAFLSQMEKIDLRPQNCMTGCTDMGDISTVMPVTQPMIAGATGTAHGIDFRIADPELACVTCAKVMLTMVAILLQEGAARAKQIIADHKPVFATRQAYFEAMDNMFLDCDAVDYAPDGTVTLSYQ